MSIYGPYSFIPLFLFVSSLILLFLQDLRNKLLVPSWVCQHYRGECREYWASSSAGNGLIREAQHHVSGYCIWKTEIILPLKRMKFSNVSSHQWIYCKDEFNPLFSLVASMKKADAIKERVLWDNKKSAGSSNFLVFFTSHSSGGSAQTGLWAALSAQSASLSQHKGMMPGNSVWFICCWRTETQPICEHLSY